MTQKLRLKPHAGHELKGVHPSEAVAAQQAASQSSAAPAPARPGNATRSDYPRMLYNADGQTLIVDSPEEHDKKMQEGWDSVPTAAFLRPKASAGMVTGSGEPLAQLIREVMEAVLDERGIHRKGVS